MPVPALPRFLSNASMTAIRTGGFASAASEEGMAVIAANPSNPRNTLTLVIFFSSVSSVNVARPASGPVVSQGNTHMHP